MRRLWLGDGLMKVWRAHYDRISDEEFARDRDILTNVGPVCGPNGWILALEVGVAVGEMGRVQRELWPRCSGLRARLVLVDRCV